VTYPTSRILAIDPGGAVAGYAVFHGISGALLEVGLSRPPKDFKTPEARARWHKTQGPMVPHFALASRVVCESMVHRPWVKSAGGRRRRIRAQDIIDLSLIAGHLGEEWVTSRVWKGDLPRETEQPRTLGRLTAAERALVDAVKPASLQHNAISAVGIGLHAVGRGWRP
jgi:hypothetical protein